MRARRSERVSRLSCSIALSILGAASAKPPPRPRPPRPAPYIQTLAGPVGEGASSRQPALGNARVLRRVGPPHRRQPARPRRGWAAVAASARSRLSFRGPASLLGSRGLLGTVVPGGLATHPGVAPPLRSLICDLEDQATAEHRKTSRAFSCKVVQDLSVSVLTHPNKAD